MPNRLADEKSPYLRQHAGNPVDWHPWGDVALARAQAEQKPIFLSIGYSTCHWCHVMAHESFENATVAEVLNRDFVPVKVDREERPDLDRIYMAYVQQTTGHGGWPMSVWLTPGGKPFYGGTYYPPDDRMGRPGFVTVLKAIARHWSEQRARLLEGADEVVAALQRYANEGGGREDPPAGALAPLPEAAGAAFEKCYQYFSEALDPVWGGFGGAPKFPRAAVINFLFRTAALQGPRSELGAEAVKMAAHTLQMMTQGGLHDHVGGGFHRYSVDERWFVPHFEKMLYDQAQIALNLLEARQATGREVFAWVARDVFAYVRRDLAGPHGGFYSAEDADSRQGHDSPDQAEGAFYVWTKHELDQVLGVDAAFFGAHFGLEAEGNVAHDPQGEFCGQNILMQRQSLVVTARNSGLTVEEADERLLASLEKLRATRARRPRPHRDDKVITAWNGLMISALAKGAQLLGETEPLAAATRAAEFIERELHDPATGVLYRSWREGRGAIAGFAEDYACLIQGLLDLYEAGFEIRWLQWAAKLQAKMDALFGDPEQGGYFNSRADDPTVILRLKEDHDGAEPAPNSVAAMNLIRLDWMLGNGGGSAPAGSIRSDVAPVDEGARPAQGSYRARAIQTIEAFRDHWSRVPQALPQMLCALEWVLLEPTTIILAGDPQAPDFRALAAVVHESPGPRRVLLCADGGPGQRWLEQHRPELAGLQATGGATAHLCTHATCQPPVRDPSALRALLT